jgi:hypothetical protein
MSIPKKHTRRKNPRPLDEQTPWPENPDGYVVPRKELEELISNQILLKAQTTAKRFMVVADAARAIGRGENVDLNWRLIQHTTSLDKSESYQRIMRAMISAIEQGHKGIMAAYCTTRYLVEYGFEYTACCNREKQHLDKLKRIMRSAEPGK